MPDVKCLKDGNFAVTNAPHLPQVRFSEGDILTDIQDTFAERLIELEYAELFDADDEESDETDGGDSKPSWRS